MLTGSQRQTKTLQYLLIATILGWISLYYSNYIPLPPVYHPIIFGIALADSNREYWRHRLSALAIPFFFELIFLWGTLPFYALGDIVGGSRYIMNIFGCIGALILVLLTSKCFLRQISLSISYPVVIVLLAAFGVTVDAVITNNSINELNKEISGSDQSFALSALIYQLLMILLIVWTMKNSGASGKRFTDKTWGIGN